MAETADEKAGLSVIGQAFLARLSEIVDGCDQRIYAVMDGARFGGLPSWLSAAGLSHRPLYRQKGMDTAVVLGGPWLVSLSMAPPAPVSQNAADHSAEPGDEELAALAERLSAEMAEAVANGDESGGGMLPADEIDRPERVKGRIEALLELVEDKPGVVFWIGDRSMSEEKIYRHLRGINRILLPLERDAVAGSALSGASAEGEIALAAGEPDQEASSIDADGDVKERYEAVVFRHADPNVIMQVFPTLSPEQVARLMGPAEQIFFAPAAEWGGSIKRGRRPQDVAAEKGMLRLTRRTIEAIGESRLQASRHRRVAVFRRSAPHLLQDMDDREALIFMERHEMQARAHGLKTERGFFQWTYLMGASDGKFIESADIRAHLNGGNADARLNDMMRLMANAAKEGIRA
jgi:hypothetical protein